MCPEKKADLSVLLKSPGPLIASLGIPVSGIKQQWWVCSSHLESIGDALEQCGWGGCQDCFVPSLKHLSLSLR